MELVNSRDLSSAGFWSVIRTLACVGRRMMLLAIVLVFVSGCSAQRMKSAMDLPEARLATIEGSEVDAHLFGVPPSTRHTVMIGSIDGEKTVPSYPDPYAVGPAMHVVEYILIYPRWWGLWARSCYDDLQFEAQEGKQYILEAPRGRDPVEVLLKDKQTGVIVTKSACKGSGSSKP